MVNRHAERILLRMVHCEKSEVHHLNYFGCRRITGRVRVRLRMYTAAAVHKQQCRGRDYEKTNLQTFIFQSRLQSVAGLASPRAYSIPGSE